MDKENCVEIHDWEVVTDSDYYVAPEISSIKLNGVVFGHPKKADGARVVTSTIIGSEGRFVQTRTGTVYFLKKSSEFYKKFLNEQSFNLNENNPIQVCK